MKKTIPFDLFKEQQTIYFDIARLGQLEDILGDSIVTIMRTRNAGVKFCMAGLTVGLQHEYPKATVGTYEDLVDAYFDNGGTIDQLSVPIIRAIMVSGIFGKIETKETEERKNAE
jgi:hypothetical protein